MKTISDRHARLNLWLCVVLHGVNHGLMAFLVPVFPSMQMELGVSSVTQMGLLHFTYLFCYAAFNLPFGLLSRWVRSKSLLTCGLALNAGAVALCGFTRDWRLLLGLMALAGAGGGSFHPVASAFLTRLFPDAKGKALGLIGLGSSIGFAAAPFVGGFVGEALGWQALCILIGCFGIVYAAIFSLLVVEPPDPSARRSGNSGERLKAEPWLTWRTAIPVALVFLLFGLRDIVAYGTPYVTTFFAEGIHGFSSGQRGILVALFYLPGMLIQPLMGWVSDRAGREAIIIASLCATAVLIWVLPGLGPIGPWLVMFGFGVVFNANVPVVDALMADLVPQSFRGTAYGIMFTFGIGLGATSPLIFGAIVDAWGRQLLGYFAAYRTAAGICLLAAVVALSVRLLRGVGKSRCAR